MEERAFNKAAGLTRKHDTATDNENCLVFEVDSEQSFEVIHLKSTKDCPVMLGVAINPHL